MDNVFFLSALIDAESSKYMKYAGIRKSLLEEAKINESLVHECEVIMQTCTSKIEELSKQLNGFLNPQPNINARRLIRREAYNG